MLYTESFKKAMVQKLLIPGGPTILELSREVGVSDQSLYNWKEKYQNNGSKYPDHIRSPRQWTEIDKYEALLEAARLTGEDLGKWLREKGLRSEHIEKWQHEMKKNLNPQKKNMELKEAKRRIKELERELNRKDKALAEMSALVVLKKKVGILWGGRGSLTEMQERQRILELFDKAIQSGARKSAACGILDLSTRTIKRWSDNPDGDNRSSVKREPANKMSEKEEEQIVSICCSERFRNLSPNGIVPILAEEGVFVASESTMYRVLRRLGLLKHRAESKPGTKSKKPGELKATGPNQVLSWDITYLKTIIKGQFYYLYLFEDVWSRLIAAWEVHSYESGDVASEIMKKLEKERCLEGVHLHSDNGSPMKSATMLATLQKLGVAPSFSRPQVSNDNPYSESLFRTLKYNVGYPKSFETIEEAREWLAKFVHWYNNEHRHSKIKYVTPMQRHTGEDKDILEKRKRTYEEAQRRNPNRWSKNIRNWDHIDMVYLNPADVQQELNEAA